MNRVFYSVAVVFAVMIFGDLQVQAEEYLSLEGDTLTGDVQMDTNDITNSDSMVTNVVNAGRILIGDWAMKVPDYVFEEGYDLPALSNVEQYIKQHGHLPEIPSAEELEATGIDLAKMNLLLLKHIEQITLHLIEQDRELRRLENRNR